MKQGPLIMYSFLHYHALTLMSTYVSPWITTSSPKQRTDVPKRLNESCVLEEPWSVSAVRIKNESARQSGEDGHVFVQLLRGSQWDRKGQSNEGREGAAGSLLHHLTLCLSCWACFRVSRRQNFPIKPPLTWLHAATNLSPSFQMWTPVSSPYLILLCPATELLTGSIPPQALLEYTRTLHLPLQKHPFPSVLPQSCPDCNPYSILSLFFHTLLPSFSLF